MIPRVDPPGVATYGKDYAERLSRTASWKRWLNVQAIYRWNLRRLDPGVTLDIGCGIAATLRISPNKA